MGSKKKEMLNYLKKNGIQIFRIVLALVIIGKILSRFLDFSDHTDYFFSAAMFCLIGSAYLVAAWAYDKVFLKLLFLASGSYLIVMNFVPDYGWNSLIGIFCILTPLVIVRFLPEEDEEENLIKE